MASLSKREEEEGGEGEIDGAQGGVWLGIAMLHQRVLLFGASSKSIGLAGKQGILNLFSLRSSCHWCCSLTSLFSLGWTLGNV